MNNEIVDAVLNFTGSAGRIALSGHRNLRVQVKPDNTYVTDIDLRLSELAFRTLSTVIPERNIVSEEHLENLASLSGDPDPDTDELVAFVDPIDGTRNYSFGIPLYGISVGMYRNRKPWIGAVAFPALGETFFCDGRNAYLITGPDATERVRLEAPHTELDANSVMLLTNGYLRKFDWSYDVCTMLVTACASLNGCWPAVRRGIGTVLTDHIWDFGGYWPILNTLGFDLRGAESGRSMTQYRATDYEAGSRVLREPVIVSRPEHFARLQSAIHPKAQRER